MTTTPEAKCDPAPYCSCLLCSYDGAPSFQLHGTPCCPQCRGAVQMFYPVAAPPKPADVAKVRRYEYDADNEHMTPEMFGTVYVVLSTDYDTLLLERDALAAKVEEMEALVRTQESALRCGIQQRDKLQAELTAERERVDKAYHVIGGTQCLMNTWLLGTEAGLHGEIRNALPYLDRWIRAYDVKIVLAKADEGEQK